MQRDAQRQKLLGRRAALIAGAQAALVATLAGRMYLLQIVDAEQYRLLADENRINLRLLPPPRGRILDRFGVVLADNRHEYRAVIIAEQTRDIPATLAALASLINFDAADRRRVLLDISRKHRFVPVVVRGNLSWDELAKIEVAVPELPGISIEQGLTRNYPFGATAAHALGYVAAPTEDQQKDDPLLELPDFRVGKSGVEKARDLALRGGAGTSEVEVNALGRVVRELARVAPRSGRDVATTLDMAIQDLATRRCAAEGSASCVVLDAPTGEILALVSVPGFDPAAFSAGLSQAAWQQLAGDPQHPLVNKAIAGTYPPGSSFKPAVAVAALTAGVITPQTEFSCPGYFRLGNAVFHCWKHGGHGTLRLRDAIKRSCDVFFYQTAQRLGIDRLAATARRFGFGDRLGLDIPGERPGLIPSREWALATSGTPWQKGQTLIAGIGQGSVLATPLQLAVMVARLATGQAIVPRLIREAGVMTPNGTAPPADFPSLGLDPAVRAIVLDGMNAVCNEQGGTGYAARIKEPGFAMGGKSGTSQVRRITDAERQHGEMKPSRVPWKDRDHALFIAFAPVGAPRYVCATVVEHGGFGAEAAAPIVRDILLAVQQRDPARQIPQAGAVAERAAPPASSPRG
jgi:penicillin-binding protein 2